MQLAGGAKQVQQFVAGSQSKQQNENEEEGIVRFELLVEQQHAKSQRDQNGTHP